MRKNTVKRSRTAEQKEALAKEIVKTMDSSDFASKDTVRVIFEEMKSEDFYSGKDMN
ncbi:tautomerase family protein [Salinicoccus sp. YB14-2]|uniref:tautomerase family protein n=1 Tax=Salinicoccus sp. YB14-2 TaxID=1572701 RepID=UPI0009E2E378